MKIHRKSKTNNIISISININISIRVSIRCISAWGDAEPWAKRRASASEMKKYMNEQINESPNKLLLKLLQVDNKTNYGSDNWGQRRWYIGRFLFLERASRSMSGEVLNFCLFLTHVCKLLTIKGAQFGPVSELGTTKMKVWRKSDQQK